MQLTVTGVYPVEADEPCHLIEVMCERVNAPLDVGKFGQEAAGRAKEFWQVAWDERFLDVLGRHELDPVSPATQPSDASFRLVFFLHYLDHSIPLHSPIGSMSFPVPTPMPARLRFITYEAPN